MDKVFKQFFLDLKRIDEKKLDKGELSVVFATKGIWDKDGDFTEDGFFGEQEIIMVPAHDWTHVPIGKGRTREEGNLAIADIKMNLEIQAARDWLSAIKFDLKEGNRPLQEYSYGFKVLDGGSEMGDRLGRRGRILRPLPDGMPGSKIWEVSPVLVGAGERTRTLAAKSANGEGVKFCEEVSEVLAAAEGCLQRSKELASLRAKEGRDLSQPNRERLAAMADSFSKVAQELAGLIKPSESKATTMVDKTELARMRKLICGL